MMAALNAVKANACLAVQSENPVVTGKIAALQAVVLNAAKINARAVILSEKPAIAALIVTLQVVVLNVVKANVQGSKSNKNIALLSEQPQLHEKRCALNSQTQACSN